ncbi:MAG: transketolase [Hydrotalea sp.]|nr:transketolase [Hydrotalea sp.]
MTENPAKDKLEKNRLLSSALRALSVAMVERAQSGHPGLPLGSADIAAVLFAKHLRCSPRDANHMARDRFVLSAGHGSALLYSLLHLLGYDDFSLAALQRFRALHSVAAGHPEHGHGAGIETTTGPLGQGLANAVGMAIGLQKIFAATPNLTPQLMPKVYVLLGDGCLMEGISEEAISLAGNLQLNNLILLFDDNHISIDGDTAMATRTDQEARFRANGFHTLSVDGHDAAAIDKALTEARGMDRPCFIACRTIIGKGAPTKQGTASAHGSALGKEEAKAVLQGLGIGDSDKFLQDFILPDEWRKCWADVAAQKTADFMQHAKQFSGLDSPKNDMTGFSGELAQDIKNYKENTLQENKPLATRVASQQAIGVFTKRLPQLVGGSADLTGSNGTKTPDHKIINRNDFTGNYIHYGVREHAMAAAMNGLALTGFVPYGGTFLVFSDYLRGALRLSAIMKQKVIYVLTHDSIGVGEDGPTHQPVEHLAALRAMPHLLVLRPCDTIETIEAWEIALTRPQPSILALSRQNLPLLRTATNSGDNHTARGGYIIYGDENKDQRTITLLATGSEVSLAVAAAKMLEKDGKKSVVVSMPSFELFRAQDSATRDKILGSAPRIAIEAGVKQPWFEWLRTGDGFGDEFIGLDDFGASAPYQEVYNERGITVENVLKVANKLL